MIHKIGSDWRDLSFYTRAGEFPRFLFALAAQVVAAFQMRDDERASGTAYWRRLREILGQSSENRRPDGLEGSIHKNLWKCLRRWANEVNQGRWGLVQLVEKRVGHHLVAEPLGQCLLRRADLEWLRALFHDFGRPDPEPYRGRRLTELVDDALTGLSSRYFTQHGLRVLNDSDRSDAAWRQIEDEYERFLREGCPEDAIGDVLSRSRRRTKRRKTVVLLQISRKGLSGGLYRLENDRPISLIPDLARVLRRCYLRLGREGPEPPHRPPREDRLLATRNDGSGAFVERRVCRVEQEVLLLIPETAERLWLDSADPGLFESGPRRYRPPEGVDRPGWEPLAGLPKGWLALRFRTPADLSGVNLDGKWIESVSKWSAVIRPEGGLILRRGVWMLGAGPTFRVVGPGDFDHLLINDEPYPLDAERRATPSFDVGEYRVRLPGQLTRGLRVRIERPRRDTPNDVTGWTRVEGGWPASASERRRSDASGPETLHGARLVGEWPPHLPPRPSDDGMPLALAAMLLNAEPRSRAHCRLSENQLLASAKTTAARSENPLLLGLLHANRLAIGLDPDEV